MACIALDEILPGSKVTVYPGQRVDAVELTMVSTGHDRHDSLQTLRRLSTENFEKKKLFLLKLPGKGNQKTYTIHFRDALELIMVLPGKFATETRKKFADIIIRYFAGDASLTPEIEANAASDHPVAQMARETLASERQDAEALKRSREQADIMFELEVQEKRERIKRLQIENEQKRYENQQLGLESLNHFKSFLSETVPGWESDKRLRLQLEDRAKNIVLNSGSTAVAPAGGAQPGAPAGAPLPASSSIQSLSISQVCQEMKLRPKTGDLVSIGKRVGQLYRERHNNQPPPKHRQWVDGAEREVNSYTEADRPVIEQACREWDNKKRDPPVYASSDSGGSATSVF